MLDLSRILAGPWATQLLADLGAEVLKIEHPRGGDDTRQWGPPYLPDAEGNPSGESAYFLAANRGKRSLAIDFARPEGAELVRALAARSQVLVENFKVGGLARHGLDWPSLRQVNPALVYCSITGYGQDGPNAQRAGYDAAIQAEAGLMSITGLPDGQPGAGPLKVGVAVADLMTGMYASCGILAALRQAESSGVGQHIDLALYDTQVAWLANQAMNHLIGGLVPGRQGSAHPNIAPYQVVAAADGHFMLAVGNDAQFQRLCQVIGQPELAADPRFRCNAERVRHREDLLALLQAQLALGNCTHWLRALEQQGVPCAAVRDIAQVFADPQVAARGLRFDLPHALGVKVPQVANPLRFSDAPLAQGPAPPLLGADTRSVLTELLGLPQARIDTLLEAGVLV